MCIKPAPRARRAWTLIEMMLGVTVFAIAGACLGSLFIFTARSFAAMQNYSILDQYNRQAMDTVTYEIRQAQLISDYSSNATTRTLSLVNGDGQPVTYTFDSPKQQVRRVSGSSARV